MKILVFPHKLEVGGTQVNAIDLSAALRDIYGHDVVVFAIPGPMTEVLETKHLRYIPAPDPNAQRLWAFNKVIKRERPDVVHVWDWWQCMHALYVAYLTHRIPLVVTDMMSVGGIEKVLPKSPLTTFGTPERVDLAKAEGRSRARLLLPPVDVHQNRPQIADACEFRKRYGIFEGDIAVVTVSRLDYLLKLESLLRTIEAIGALGGELPLRLIIVGDGYARQELQNLADAVNSKLNRQAVLLVGEMLDPRPAYAGADILVGMGGSALRGMSFAKPVIIVGGNSFATTFSPENSQSFLYHGLYGIGDPNAANQHLIESIRELATNSRKRSELGDFSRNFVEANFSVEAVSAQLHAYCVEAAAVGVKPLASISDGFRTATFLARRPQTWSRFSWNQA